MGLGKVRPEGRIWKSATWDCASKWKNVNVWQEKIFLNFNESSSSLNKLYNFFLKDPNLTNLATKDLYLA